MGSANGEYITDENGRIVIEGLEPGITITAKEIKTLEGYVLDTTPKSIKIKVGEVQTLRFYNAKQGTIVIRKLDKQTGEPLAGVEFQITYSDGSYLDDDYGHLSSKGLYKTDANGEIRISGVVGTLVITETKPLPGYVMDEGTKTQTVKVNASDTQTITVYNTKIGGLTIIKKDEETGERIKGVQFEVRKMNGEIIGTYTTDTNGVINLPEAEKGWYQVVELKAAKGYKLDDTPHQIEVKDGGTATLEITNRQAGSALIHKIDSVTGKGIFGVKFLLSDAKGNPIGTYESDNEGYVYIDKELDDGRYTIREIECAEGYILDTQPKTVYVEYGGCTTITWKNTAVTGQIQITKTSADYNSMNGWPAGTPIPGTVFEIYHYRTGKQSTHIGAHFGAVGCLRGDMGEDGQEFHTGWENCCGHLWTSAFLADREKVLDALRHDERYGCVFKNRATLTAYCKAHPESDMGHRDREYAFRLDTEQYTYFMRLCLDELEFDFELYPYRRDLFDLHVEQAERASALSPRILRRSSESRTVTASVSSLKAAIPVIAWPVMWMSTMSSCSPTMIAPSICSTTLRRRRSAPAAELFPCVPLCRINALASHPPLMRSLS